MAGAIHHQIGAEAADNVAHLLDSCLRRPDLFDIDGGFSAELARELQPRRLRRTDADDAACPHLLRGGDRENPDRTRTLDHDGVAPAKPAGPGGAIEGAD